MTDTYRDFILDQLAVLGGELESRKMFGGYGIYLGAAFFGILFGGRLYFKTDEASRGEYEARGMQPFQPNDLQTLSHYYEVPIEVVEDRDRLVLWARRAARVEG